MKCLFYSGKCHSFTDLLVYIYTIHIPGWFAVLQRLTGNEKADDNVPHFKTVEELANSNTDKFLIGGTKSIHGLHVFQRSESQLNHQQRQFTPGDILIRDKVFFGETKKRSRLFRKPKYITEKFLMCRDDADREILLPFEQKGIFYQISEKCGKPNHNVMQMSDIVARNIPPRIIKLVFGRFPVTPCMFTGLMKVDTSRLESSIIASTIINTKNILIEIPLTANMQFRIVKLTDELKNNACYKNAMNLCMERATTYMRNIKVCYNFSHVTDENLQLIKKESDMELISSDEHEAMDDLLSSGEMKTHAKKSSSLKRRFRKTKSLERNNNNVGEKEKKSSLKRRSPKINHTKHPGHDMKDQSNNGHNDGVAMRYGIHTRFSHEVESENTAYIRSGRSFSTGRMSFCFGNSYLTVPVFESDLSTLDESKDKSIEKLNELVNESPNKDDNETFPPPMPCTNIGSYVNTAENALDTLTVDNTQNRRLSDVIYNENFGQYVDSLSKCGDNNNTRENSEYVPPKPNTETQSDAELTSTSKDSGETKNEDGADQVSVESDTEDYIPVSSQRRPSSKPPDFAPPSLPSLESPSSCRNSVRTSTSSNTSECINEERRLSGQSQYDVPKIQEPDDIDECLAVGDASPQKTRRPSTFMFTEGFDTNPNKGSGKTSMPAIKGLREETGFIGEAQRVRRPSTYTFTEGLGALQRNDIIGMPLINEFGSIEDDSPIYENIQALQELMLTMENLDINDNDIEGVPNNNTQKELQHESFENNTDFGNDTVTECQNDRQGGLDHCAEGKEQGHDNSFEKVEEITDDNIITNNAVSNEEFDEPGDLFVGVNRAVLENDRKLTKSVSVESRSSKISKQSSIGERPKSISELTADEFIAQLEQIGIRDNSLNSVKELDIDGKFLSSVAHDDESLKDCLPGVSLIDLQKISMFLRGWRPHEEV